MMTQVGGGGSNQSPEVYIFIYIYIGTDHEDDGFICIEVITHV